MGEGPLVPSPSHPQRGRRPTSAEGFWPHVHMNLLKGRPHPSQKCGASGSPSSFTACRTCQLRFLLILPHLPRGPHNPAFLFSGPGPGQRQASLPSSTSHL